jgi:hypothetical protein
LLDHLDKTDRRRLRKLLRKAARGLAEAPARLSSVGRGQAHDAGSRRPADRTHGGDRAQAARGG